MACLDLQLHNTLCGVYILYTTVPIYEENTYEDNVGKQLLLTGCDKCILYCLKFGASLYIYLLY